MILTQNITLNINEYDYVIYNKALEALPHQLKRYTSSMCSSVKTDTAREILKSICYSYNEHIKNGCDIEKFKKTNADELLFYAQKNLQNQISQTKINIKMVMDLSPKIQNISYCDTLKSINNFDKVYDYMYFAHNIPASIDYQLSMPVSENKQGLCYINTYLSHLLIENKFCKQFDDNTLRILFAKGCKNYRELLINIFEIVLTNALGCVIACQNPYEILLSDNSKLILENRLLFRDYEQIKLIVLTAVESLCHSMKIENQNEKKYIFNDADSLCSRIYLADNITNIFF